jgi:hypothetical protein
MSFGFVRIRYNPVQDDQISTSNAAVLSPSLEPQVEDSIVMLGERGHYFLLSYCVFRFPDAQDLFYHTWRAEKTAGHHHADLM